MVFHLFFINDAGEDSYEACDVCCLGCLRTQVDAVLRPNQLPTIAIQTPGGWLYWEENVVEIH